MKTTKAINEQIEKLEFKIKWYQTSINLMNSEITYLRLRRDLAEMPKREGTRIKGHHGNNKFGDKY